MYESFYGFSSKPFNLTPDPRFLYLSEKHKEAFSHLLYGIQNRTGFVMVAGEIGTGKTTICRSLLSQLDNATEIAFIFNPFLSPEELLRKINEEFGIPTRARTIKGIIDELNEYLLKKAEENKNCVLVIDEAQNLAPEVLEQVRLLSNLETETQKLLQIVLIGQPELVATLEQPELRQLNQRITARYHLKELNFDETLQYVAFRLRVAGGNRKVRFNKPAVKAVFRYSGGTPRVINSLCDRALLIGYTKETMEITPKIVRQAAEETQGEGALRKSKLDWQRLFPRRVLAPVAVLAMAVAALVMIGPATVIDRAKDLIDSARTQTAAEPSPPMRQAENPAPPFETNAAILPDEKTDDTATELTPAPPAANVVEAAVVLPSEVQLRMTPAPADVAKWLSSQDGAALQSAGLTALMKSWNMAVLTGLPADAALESIQRFAAVNGMAFEELNATLDQLEVINLPALAHLKIGDRSDWTLIAGLGLESYTVVSANGERAELSRESLRAAYQDHALFLWVDPSRDAGELARYAAGDDVRALQQILSVLGLLQGAQLGNFDAETETVIRGIQRATGLKIDGIAGRQTRMVLTNWLESWPGPSLTSESFSPDVARRVQDAIAQERGAP